MERIQSPSGRYEVRVATEGASHPLRSSISDCGPLCSAPPTNKNNWFVFTLWTFARDVSMGLHMLAADEVGTSILCSPCAKMIGIGSRNSA